MVLYFLGLIGTLGYGLHCIKNDIKAEKTDLHLIPTINDDENKADIFNHFTSICDRSGIQLNKDNEPLYLEDVHLGMEYLQYRGYNHECVDFFKEVYTQAWEQLMDKQEKRLRDKHNKLLQQYHGGDTIMTVRCHYYGDDKPQYRMNKIYSYPLWNKLVDNFTYIRGQHGNAKYTEVWNLKIESGFLTEKQAKRLYEEICVILNI